MNIDKIISKFRKPEPKPLFWLTAVKKIQWDLDDCLFNLKTDFGLEPIRLRDLLRGVQIFGAIGSGKTSGSGQQIAWSFLMYGFGGIVFCVKDSEVETWRRYAKATNRESDLIVIDKSSKFRFNFIDEEIKKNGPSAISHIRDLILDVHALSVRDGKQSRDSFWDNQLSTYLTNALIITTKRDDTLTIAGVTQTIRDAVDFASDGAQAQTLSPHRFVQYCKELLSRFESDKSLVEAVNFFLVEFKATPEKTRSIVVAMYRALVEPLMHEPLQSLFCTDTNVRPSDCFDGKIIVVDLSVHEFRQSGLLAQLIWKMVFAQAVKDRKEISRPVFMWADESQFFAEQRDVDFFTVARDKRCAIVYATQNIPNYDSKIGNEASVNAILGSLHLKIYHQNSDPKTNASASDTIGKIHVSRDSVSKDAGGGGTFSSGRSNVTTSEVLEYDVPPRLFTNLKEGGSMNKMIVEGILHLPGRKFLNGKTWTKASFDQKIKV